MADEDDVLRTPANVARYRARKKERGALDLDLRTLPVVRDFIHWVLVVNEFPYDKILSDHHLLVPRDYFEHDWEMPEYARKELQAVRMWAEEAGYDSLIENMPGNRTIKPQFHLHLVKWRYVSEIK